MYEFGRNHYAGEYISLAAIKIKENGSVAIGLRHGSRSMLFDCGVRILSNNEIDILNQEKAERFFIIEPGQITMREYIEGFITSTGRFVDRELAWEIALVAGQIDYDVKELVTHNSGQKLTEEQIKLLPEKGKLYSENLV